VRALGGLLALVLFVLPLLAAPVQPVAAIGVVGLALAGLGIAVRWAGPVTAATCAFLVEYAAALTASGEPVSLAGAAAFSLALFFLLHVADFARRVGDGRVEVAVLRAHAQGWLGVCAGAAAAGLVALAIAGTAAVALPFSASALLAGLGALGVLAALAAILRRATGEHTLRTSRRPPSRRG
jgi:hypothetical protein